MIEIRSLSYKINGNIILEDINLTLVEGEFAALIGPNGAGKSTLIKLILGFLPLQTGSIYIDGIPHWVWLKEHPIGYLPQHEEFNRHFPATALDIVLMGLVAELPPGSRFKSIHRQRAMQTLSLTGIAHLANHQIGSLSGGELQRVFLARALISDSKYLILDEPEASLDQPGVQSLFILLKDLNKAGKTILTISHDLNILSEYCTFLICLNRKLHCHTSAELVNAEIIHKTFGDTMRLIEKDY